MAQRTKMERRKVRSAILTLRMTNEEMLRFKLAAIAMGKKRAKIVRERVADLIGGTVSTAVAGDRDTVTVAVDETVITGNTVSGCSETADVHGGRVG